MLKLDNIRTALTYDDVVLVPKYSEVLSRKEPSTKTRIGGMELDIPVVASPMNTVTEHQTMIAMSMAGGSSVLHRYMTTERQIEEIIKALEAGASKFWFAVGATGDYLERAEEVRKRTGINDVCVDVANGHSISCIEATKKLYSRNFNVMAGNVATYIGAQALAYAGASVIRVGIGQGSLCVTRVVTGHGIPSLTSIEDCLMAIEETGKKVSLIMDGGIRSSGDAVKSLAVGADAVMIGGMLAGTDETPGKVHDGRKIYAGMASSAGRELGGWFDREKTSFVPEGESMTVPCKGPAKNVLDSLVGGIKVGMSYSGALSLSELYINSSFMQVTHSGLIEGGAHGKR